MEKELTQAQKDAKKALLTGHFPYFLQALTIAYQRVPVWRFAKDGTPCSIIDLFQFGKNYDQDHPRKEGDRSFFYVTIEGAIGYSASGVEYDMAWLFLPMEPGEERNAIMAKVKDEYDKAEEALKAEEEAKKAAEEAAKAAAAAPKKRFCTHCGAEIKNPNAKFCASCGQPIK